MKKYRLILMALICVVNLGFVACDKDDGSAPVVNTYYLSDISAYDYPLDSVWYIQDESITTEELDSFVATLRTIYENSDETRVSLVFTNLESLPGAVNKFSLCDILYSVTFSKLSSGTINFRACRNLTELSFPYHTTGEIYYDESLSKITYGTLSDSSSPANLCSADTTAATSIVYLSDYLVYLEELYYKAQLCGNTGKCTDLKAEMDDYQESLESELKSASSLTTLVTKKDSSYSIYECDNCDILVYSSSQSSLYFSYYNETIRITSCSIFKEIIYQ